jgi:hypothetical protein
MLRKALVTAAVLVTLSSVWWAVAAQPRPSPRRKPGRNPAPAITASIPGQTASHIEALKQFQAGNYRDAYELYRKLALDPKDDVKVVGNDLAMGINCLNNLARNNEVDAFREAVIEVHKKNWRLLQAAAQSYAQGEHQGFLIVGKFERGGHRGGGKMVNSSARDHVRALQLMTEAMPLADKDENKPDVAGYNLLFASMIRDATMGESWRLQTLTDITKLPDYEEGYYGWGRRGYYGGGGSRGAPVDADGKPVYYQVPKNYADAKNDGERWRWLLTQAIENNPSRISEIEMHYANFLQTEFSEQTLAAFGWNGGQVDDDTQKNDSGTFALHTLGEDETIAKLANGIKRFKLPDEFNFIRLYQRIAARDKSNYASTALEILARTFENRRQYLKAVEYWKKVIAEFGPGNQDYRLKSLEQITKNWGRFENGRVHPAGSGQGATVEFRFRNGTKVDFEAHEILVEKLITDVKAYLKGSPPQVNYQKINIADLGYRLVQQNESQYLGAKVASWSLDLKPRPNHVDDRVTVATPLQKAGAYLLVGKMPDGNVSRVIIWIADTAIIKKQLDGKSFYYVADALGGQPVAKANVEFFGWRQVQVKPNTNQYRVDVNNFAEFTNADGQIIVGEKEMPSGNQWLIMARNDAGRFAYLGFTGVWYGRYYDQEYNQTKTFVITDRPVYRPKQKVQFKVWIGQAKYDQEGKSPFAGQKFQVAINDPQGTQIYTNGVTADEFGGLIGEYDLPKDAKLGAYYLNVQSYGGNTFRVEEYKKPEYEVKVDAPKEPVSLGEKITATIQAKYYFGAPVTKAKVKYKVLRTSHTSEWYPYGIWDWFYGKGYWWFASDYVWYPGWHNWGCHRPIPVWWYNPTPQPEVVSESEGEIGADGTVKIVIDTKPAKELHPNQDHKYSITAEVVDESRRTIVGTGDVLVARKPFRVFGWVGRGHYRVGDTIEANFQAQTLDQKPVEGKGKLSLLKISYDDKQQPVETVVQSWDLDTNVEGRATQQMKASEPGQYRLSYKLTDSKQHTIEGGYLFVITGTGFDGREFRFNDLELVTDKREYAPGETVKLLINTNRAGGAVLLFLRPTNGVYLPPKLVRLTGKSQVEEVAVIKKDMPNFFIEALTVANGQTLTEVREVVVPPEKRVLDVKVLPSQKEYKPGEQAKIEVRLSDLNGKPFIGSTVLTMYDRSVEYISGGSNVPEIKEFFWKWRRHHTPSTESNLERWFGNIVKYPEITMNNLGMFGESIVEELVGPKAGQKPTGVAKSKRSFGGGMVTSEMSSKYGIPAAAPMMMKSMNSAVAGRAMADAAPAEAKAEGGAGGLGGGGGDAAMPEPSIRKDFADTAVWASSLTTNNDGVAEISLKMPENLTGWKVKAWGMGAGTRVGEGETEVFTKKNVLLRLQAPRFFVETDEVVLSANVHNYLKTAKQARVVLELDGATLAPMGSTTQTVTIDANGEKRVDWRVSVKREGEAVIRMKVLTDEESDATEMKFPVYVHGMLKMESFAGVIRPDKTNGSVTLDVPTARRISESRLEVRYSPTLAGAMVDALPYLVDYPYGCTEQTLNRFLPTVITQNILLRMKLDLKAIRDKRSNLNSQEIGDDKERAKGWKRYDRNPVFDPDEVRAMVKDGVKKLTEMQLSDGGWGWFSGYGEYSWPHTTAVVVHGLQVAKLNDVALVPGMLERGIQWLKNYQDAQVQLLKNAAIKDKPPELRWKSQADNLDAYVYMVLVDADVANGDMLEFLYRDRTHLSVYSLAMYGLALEKQKQADKLKMVLQNIDQYLVQDEENQTAYLKLPEGYSWWYWHGNEIEADAFYLKLLSKTDPKGEKASRLVKYLLNNRKHASYWNSTRDSALCIEALAEYMVASGEDKPDMTLEVLYDGKKQKEVKIDGSNLFTFDNKFVLTGDAVDSGKHTVELRKKGTGPVYFNAYLTNFTLESFIKKAGLEVKVQRKYYKLRKVEKSIKVSGSRGQAADQKVEKYERDELPSGATLKSGDLVEIELEIDSKNDYEYLIFEDMKAAGFEAMEVRSGYNGNEMGAYVEFRDEKVCFFVRSLSRGKHSLSFRMRAEIPGKFSALPTKGFAMYAPELKGNSDEMKINIVD